MARPGKQKDIADKLEPIFGNNSSSQVIDKPCKRSYEELERENESARLRYHSLSNKYETKCAVISRIYEQANLTGSISKATINQIIVDLRSDISKF